MADVLTKPRRKAKAIEAVVPQSDAADQATPSRTKKILLLASAKGGSGKTSTSINLAVAAAHAGLRTATVDMDRQQTLSKWYRQRPEEAPHIEHFVIPLSETKAGLAEIEAADDIDLVIIDTPPGVEDHPEQVRQLVKRADFVLVPTGQGKADIDSVLEWMGFLAREGAKAAFMLNATNRKAKSYEQAKIRLVKAGALCPIDVRLLEDLRNVHGTGVGIFEISGASGTEDLEGVWAFVRQALGV